MSDPIDRVIATRRAKPNLASQAPNVRREINKNGFSWEVAPHSTVRKQAKDKIMASKDKREDSKCFRWISKVKIVEKDRSVKIKGDSITGRIFQWLIYKINASFWLFRFIRIVDICIWFEHMG